MKPVICDTDCKGVPSIYLGELKLTVALKTHLRKELFDELFDDNGLRARLVLELSDGQTCDADVLLVNSAKWYNEGGYK